MKISLVQFKIKWEDKNANLENAERIVDFNKDSDLILFPEMSFTGFSMNTSVTSESDLHTIARMKTLARIYTTYIGFGWVREGSAKDKRCENVYTIISPNGEEISEYVKIHPFSYSRENEKFKGGEKILSYNIGDIPFATFICYDLRFPELFRAVVDEAHVIIVPACWPAKRAEHWKTLLKARAIENQVYMIGVNCQGDIGGQYYSGDSCVINPVGEVLAMLSGEDGVVTYEISDDVKEYRKQFPVLKDRRIKLCKNYKI